MKTVSDNLREAASEIKSTLQVFLLDHSSIRKWNSDHSGIFSFSGNYAWQKLDKEGLRIQSKVLEDYRIFSAILRLLLVEQSKNSHTIFNDADKIILDSIEQEGSTWSRATKEVLENVNRSIDSIT